VSQATERTPQSVGKLATAGVLAWLLPGAGHLYLGERFKGTAFFLLLNLLFLTGLVISHGNAISLHEEDGHRYAFLAEVCVGGPSLIALAIAHREELAAGMDEEAVSKVADKRRDRWVTQRYIDNLAWLDTGLLFCMVAGLLNLLVVFEAATGARGLGADAAGQEVARAAGAASESPLGRILSFFLRRSLRH